MKRQPTLTTEPSAAGPGVAPPYVYRRLYRDPGNRVLGGVAAGLAEHLGVWAVVVRVVFIVLLAADGLGALLYIAFWAVLPANQALPRKRSATPLQVLGLLALTAGTIVLRVKVAPYGGDTGFVALLALVALGAGIIWHQADATRRRRIVEAVTDASIGPPVTPVVAVDPAVRRPADPVDPIADRRWFPIRLVGGGLLVVVGIIGILGFFAPKGNDGLSATLTGLLFGLLALAGLVLALAPLFYRVFGQLREERVARIREQERAEVAAVVHDQVLHTLALIQRNAGDTTSVVRLARGQERTLRNWLYRPVASPTERFAAALEQAGAEVEDSYGISVETVVVGDAPTDDRVAAIVAATREALVNAARHAKVATVSLYAEAEQDQLKVFVRDRGSGFELSEVDDDRHGVRGSIIGRMDRHGGRAEIRSAPGEGTEVELTMPRSGGNGHD